MEFRDVGQGTEQERALIVHSLGICLLDRGFTVCGEGPVQLATQSSPVRQGASGQHSKALGSKVEKILERRSQDPSWALLPFKCVTWGK